MGGDPRSIGEAAEGDGAGGFQGQRPVPKPTPLMLSYQRVMPGASLRKSSAGLIHKHTPNYKAEKPAARERSRAAGRAPCGTRRRRLRPRPAHPEGGAVVRLPDGVAARGG